jgi:hypothetical protein
MSRRLAVALATVAVAVCAVAPATAAPKPVKGSYDVTLLPDPTLNVADGCAGLNPAATDDHPFTVPGAGVLEVKLTTGDLQGQADWDMYLVKDGEVLAASEGATAAEQIAQKFKAKTALSIQVCNLVGEPDGTVSFTFTPKK